MCVCVRVLVRMRLRAFEFVSCVKETHVHMDLQRFYKSKNERLAALTNVGRVVGPSNEFALCQMPR